MMQLARVSFTVDELRKVPQHAGFFVASCLAINEIHTLQRAFLLALNTRATSRPIKEPALQEIAFSQCAIIERNISAKLLEYIKLIGDYPKICARAKTNTLEPFTSQSAAVAEKIRSARGYELAIWYRNSVTSHYLLSEVIELIAHGDIGSSAQEHEIYLHESEGNSAYLLGERIVLAKLGADKGDAIERMKEFGDWVQGTVKQVMSLHSEFCIQFMEQIYPSHVALGFTVEPEPHLIGELANTVMPILWAEHRPPTIS